MAADRPRLLAFAGVAALGLLALLQTLLADRRPAPPERRAATELVVTSGADAGWGSLREAVFAAARAPGRARVVLRAPRVTLATPLPPLINPHGVVIETAGGGGEIDAAALADGPVLDVAAPGSELRGVAVHGAAGEGIRVRAPGVRLRDVAVVDSATGVLAAAEATELVIEESRFEDNGIGVRLESGGRLTALRRNRFRGHDDAAVWAVGNGDEPVPGAPLEVAGNRFADDRISLLLSDALVTGNDLEGARETAVFLLGGAAVVRDNRIRAGPGMGVYARGARGALVAGNEIDHLRSVAILVHSCRNTVVRDNRISTSGYGIAHVFGEAGRPDVIAGNLLLDQRFDGIYVVGGSPVIRGNRALGSRGAGLRILDFVPAEGARTAADPLLEDNTFAANGADAPQRGVYREGRAAGGGEA